MLRMFMSAAELHYCRHSLPVRTTQLLDQTSDHNWWNVKMHVFFL